MGEQTFLIALNCDKNKKNYELENKIEEKTLQQTLVHS